MALTNIDRLPGNLEDVEILIKRREAARRRKEIWRSVQAECYRYSLPARETFNWTGEGQAKETLLFDSTLQECTYTAANTMTAVLFPPWTRWGDAVPGSEIPRDDPGYKDIVEGLQNATDTFFHYLNHSNFAMVAHEVALDLQIGTGGLQFAEGDAETPFRFTSLPLPALELEEGPDGRVESTFMERHIEARNLVRTYEGMEEFDLPDDLRHTITNDPEKKIQVVQCEVYHPANGRYYAIVVLLQEKKIIWRVDYGTSCPNIIARATKVAGETYGRGRVMRALADARTLDKMQEFVLRHAALQIAPPFTAVSDGVLNPYTASVAPNTVLPVASNDTTNPSLAVLEVGGHFMISDAIMEKLRERVRRTMLGPEGVDGPVRSATEVARNDRDRLWAMNGEYSRVQDEFLTKIFIRGIDILQRLGKIPKFKLNGKAVSLRFASPFAKSQNTDDVLAMQDALFSLTQGGIPVEAITRSIKIEDVPAWIFEKKGVDMGLVRSPDEILEWEEKAKAIAAAQMQLQGTEAAPPQLGGAVNGDPAAQAA